MILSDLRAYLAHYRRVPMTDIVARFDVSPEAARGMLDHFIDKGWLRRVNGAGCSGCNACGDEGPEVYEWLR
jgi:DeoR/GlpR family transcriptional regulator of sugar metabolism